jgi:hypothetical protein
VELTLTDPVFSGVSEDSSNFYAPISYGIVGDTITLDIPGSADRYRILYPR